MAFMSSSDMVDMSWPACGSAAGVAVAVGVGAGTGAGAVLRAEGAGVRVVAGCRPDAALGVSFVGSAASSVTGSEATGAGVATTVRSEEHTSELQSLMRISYAVFCLKKKKTDRKLSRHRN